MPEASSDSSEDAPDSSQSSIGADNPIGRSLDASSSDPADQISSRNPSSAESITSSVGVTMLVGSILISVDQSSQLIVSDETVNPGSPITLHQQSSDIVISLSTGASETVLRIGGSTIHMSSAMFATDNAASKTFSDGVGNSDDSFTQASMGTPSPSAASEGVDEDSQSTGLPPAFTLGSSVYTPDSESEYIIASQTLQLGGAITVSGSMISLASNGAEIVVGAKTETAAPRSGVSSCV